MYFGEYLLEKGMLNEDQLVDTLACQIEQLPSFLSLIKNNNILSNKEILNIVEKQIKNKTDILDIIRKDDILSNEKIKELFTLQMKNKKTLTEILVEKNIVSLDKIEVAIKDYIEVKKNTPNVLADIPTQNDSKEASVDDVSSGESNISAAALESLKELGLSDQNEISELESQVIDTPEGERIAINQAALDSLKELGVSDESEITSLESKVSSTNNSEIVEETEISSAALESLKELGLSDDGEIKKLESQVSVKKSAELELDVPIISENTSSFNETFLEQLLDTFDVNMHTRLKKIVSIIEDTAKADGDIANFFNSLYRDFHVLKGVARLCEAKNLENLIDKWEMKIEVLFNNSNEENKIWVHESLSDLSDTIELLWRFRESISESKSENLFLSSEENKEHFEKLCNAA